MKRRKFKNIIFDFDGTLVDSRNGIVKSFKRVVEELSSKRIKDREIIELLGNPLTKIISVLLKTQDRFLLDKGSDLFRKYYNTDGIRDNKVYSGIRDALDLLTKQSCQLFIVSNKIEEFIVGILDQNNLRRHFKSIIGTDGTDPRSMKSYYIKLILNDFKLDKQRSVIVGDTENDIIAGKANSIYSVGVTWGYGTKASLLRAGADKIVNKPIELIKLLNG